MFAVPEVDDDIDPSSSSVESTKPPTQSEVITDSLPSILPVPSPTPVSTIEKEENTSITTQVSPPPSTDQQHFSRLSQFQRDQVLDRM